MTALTTTNRNALRDILFEAQEHLNEAISLLSDYVRQANDSYAETYLVDHLRIMAGRNHNFLGRDLNVDDLIEQLDDREGDEEDDEQPEASYPKRKATNTGDTLYLLENNNGPILNAFGEPIYVTIPED